MPKVGKKKFSYTKKEKLQLNDMLKEKEESKILIWQMLMEIGRAANL